MEGIRYTPGEDALFEQAIREDWSDETLMARLRQLDADPAE